MVICPLIWDWHRTLMWKASFKSRTRTRSINLQQQESLFKVIEEHDKTVELIQAGQDLKIHQWQQKLWSILYWSFSIFCIWGSADILNLCVLQYVILNLLICLVSIGCNFSLSSTFILLSSYDLIANVLHSWFLLVTKSSRPRTFSAYS